MGVLLQSMQAVRKYYIERRSPLGLHLLTMLLLLGLQVRVLNLLLHWS